MWIIQFSENQISWLFSIFWWKKQFTEVFFKYFGWMTSFFCSKKERVILTPTVYSFRTRCWITTEATLTMTMVMISVVLVVIQCSTLPENLWTALIQLWKISYSSYQKAQHCFSANFLLRRANFSIFIWFFFEKFRNTKNSTAVWYLFCLQKAQKLRTKSDPTVFSALASVSKRDLLRKQRRWKKWGLQLPIIRIELQDRFLTTSHQKFQESNFNFDVIFHFCLIFSLSEKFRPTYQPWAHVLLAFNNNMPSTNSPLQGLFHFNKWDFWLRGQWAQKIFLEPD